MTALVVDQTDATSGDPPAPDAAEPGGAEDRLWNSVLRQPGLLISFAVIALVVAWAFLPELFTNLDPVNGVPPSDKLSPPSANTGSERTTSDGTPTPGSYTAPG